jgi:hypothetical protein
MPASKYNINADQGSSFELYIEYQTSGSTAIDLAAYDARMQVRPSFTSPNIILDFTGNTASTSLTGGGSTGYYVDGTTGVAATGGILLNSNTGGVVGTTGGVYITADAVAMSNVLAGEHRYDLELVTGTTVTRILEGVFEVQPEVTK